MFVVSSMKTSFFILAIMALSFIASAQEKDNCVFYLNGKEFSSLSKATKTELANFRTLELKDVRVGKMLKPVSFEWVFSSQGKIMHGTLRDCARLDELLKNSKPKDILFIDKIKYEGVTGLCEGQFALTIE